MCPYVGMSVWIYVFVNITTDSSTTFCRAEEMFPRAWHFVLYVANQCFHPPITRLKLDFSNDRLPILFLVLFENLR